MKNIHQSILCTLVKSANKQINSWFVDQRKEQWTHCINRHMGIPRTFSKINPKHKYHKACILVSTLENMDKERSTKITKHWKKNSSTYKINVTIFFILGGVLLDQFLPLLIIFSCIMSIKSNFIHNTEVNDSSIQFLPVQCRVRWPGIIKRHFWKATRTKKPTVAKIKNN